jgi:hypothetical protein
MPCAVQLLCGVRRHPAWRRTHPAPAAAPARASQALNSYADQLSKGQRPQASRVDFYVRGSGGALSPVSAELPARGSLVPLLLAFGLVSAEDAQRAAASEGASSGDPNDGRDLFEWLSGVAAEAARAGDQHDALKRAVRSLRGDVEAAWGLAAVDVGGEFAVNGDEQARQLEALGALQAGFEALAAEDEGGAGAVAAAFAGLRLRLYHPDVAPLVNVGFQDADGTFNMRSESMGGHVADDGTLHVVGDPSRVAAALGRLPLERARLLSRVSSFWRRRSRDLSAALKAGLAVDNVWCDTRSDDAAQRFVLWAGAVLERRRDLDLALRGRRFSFSLLVHGDESSPLLDFIAASSVLQVRADCPPRLLLDFMSSEAGAMAHEAAAQVAGSREEEEAVLARVRDALGAKHVVRVCSSYDQPRVLDAARRLIDAAPAIRAVVDLAGVSLAIDDCYDIWDSGFISIPFDFSLAELQPQLQALLAPAGPSAGGGGGGGEGERGGAPRSHAGPTVAGALPLLGTVLQRLERARLAPLRRPALGAWRGLGGGRRAGSTAPLPRARCCLPAPRPAAAIFLT